MKKILISFLFFVSSSLILYAQAPHAFKYQAIARDETGNILSMWEIGLRVSLIQAGNDGQAVYIETHRVQTNIYGLINIVIGEGVVQKGDISTIKWGENKHYLKMEMDINSGDNYKEVGISQLYAVPYALYADEAGKLREPQDQSRLASSSEAKTGSRSNRPGNQGGSRNGDPNSKIPATGNGFLNATSGNLGVGTTSPAEKLHVLGNIIASGSIHAQDNLILIDSEGNPREVILNPDGTLTLKFKCAGRILDIRDNQYYNITKIGTQCWMAENLNVGINIGGSMSQNDNSVIEKDCYDDIENNCNLYGGLYQWDELMNYITTEGTQGICPESWHIPADWEWNILEGNVDSNFGIGNTEWDGIGMHGFDVGKKLKTTYGWLAGGNGTDDYGFSALPAGYYDPSAGDYFHITIQTYFWTSTESLPGAYTRSLSYPDDGLYRGPVDKTSSLSLRCIKDFECGDSITDQRDGQRYGTVEIGTQCWMSQNLNVGLRVDGEYFQKDNSIVEKYCYENNEGNCDTLGGLYQWDEAMQYVDTEGAQGICPPTDGWHIPTYADWIALRDYLGGAGVAGGKMKSTGTIETGTGLWYAPNLGATNESGFSGLPGGSRNLSDGLFYSKGEFSFFWSSSEFDESASRLTSLIYTDPVLMFFMSGKFSGYSLRCLKD